MAIVYAPGEIVEEVWPEDKDKPTEEQTVTIMKVPDVATQRQILRVQAKFNNDPLEKLRTVFGLQVEDIRNFKVLRGGQVTDFVLEKDSDGRITTDCIAMLAWKADQIQACLDKLGRVSREDIKNS